MNAPKAHPIGINHVALVVGDLDEALAFYGALFALRLRGRHGSSMAWLDLGDQFVALAAGGGGGAGAGRHFGLVVDSLASVRAALRAAGVAEAGGRGLRFSDPWGNEVEVVQYDEVQFTKTPEVLRGMGAGELGKTEAALAELREKGLGG